MSGWRLASHHQKKKPSRFLATPFGTSLGRVSSTNNRHNQAIYLSRVGFECNGDFTTTMAVQHAYRRRTTTVSWSGVVNFTPTNFIPFRCSVSDQIHGCPISSGRTTQGGYVCV